MRSSAFRLIILVSSIVIALLVAVQLIWLNKQYNYEQRNFTRRIVKIVREVYENLPLTGKEAGKLAENMEFVGPDDYIFHIDHIPSKDSLVLELCKGLEENDLQTDCKMALYDESKKGYVYEIYIPAAASHHPLNSGIDLVPIRKGFSYVQLHFPHRSGYLLQSMWLWISLSVSMILVLLALSICIFYLYKQKFLNEIQKDFINNVTHEFQTPLTTLQLGLEVLGNPGIIQQPEKIRKYTSIMSAQTGYLRHHLENLMLVIRADADILHLDKQVMNFNNLIDETMEQMSFFAEEKKARFEFYPEVEEIDVEVDKHNMILVLQNLFANAIKYSEDPLITIRTSRENGSLVLKVIDNGIGIEEKYIKQLFRKFYRVPNGNVHNSKGLGLGLYFVKKVISLHGGKILVFSQKGQGTEFRITLPLI